MPPPSRRAAVLGCPVEHSLSPVLHGTAYRALGLDWAYDRVECDEDRLPALVADLGPEWAGLSVTMPGKRAALLAATTATPRAVAVGAANTLVHQPDGTWHADCTDIDGIVGALRVAGGFPLPAGARPPQGPSPAPPSSSASPASLAGPLLAGAPGGAGSASAPATPSLPEGACPSATPSFSATPLSSEAPGPAAGVVLGAGGTACAALAAFAALGLTSAVVVVRDPARAGEAVACAARLGLPIEVRRWSDADFAAMAGSAAVLVNTAPAAATAPLATELARACHVLDVIYHPWPTPLAEAVARAGGHLATGLDMLLHQAFGQVEQFTGLPAPRQAMRDALRDATGGTVPLPL